jgi:hypothetical protein
VELAGGADEIRIKYSKALEAVGVEARIEGFTLVGNSPRAKLVVRLGGDTAEFAIRLDRDNTVRLEFTTTNREEAERRAALLRALGVDAETREKHEPPNRVKWRIAVSTNALAADSVHSVVREAVAEFLKLCREANIITDKTYEKLAPKFERGVPPWREIKFSITLKKDGAVEVRYEPKNPQSFKIAVEYLQKLGLRDRCGGEWCFIHFTAREPRGGEKGYVYITADGLRYIGWLALHGEGDVKKWAAELRDNLLKEAERRGEDVYRRLKKIFEEGERWGTVHPPIEKEVEVEGRRLKIRVEEVEAWKEKSETKERLVVKIRAKVEEEEGGEAAVEKEAKFYKHPGRTTGYIHIHAHPTDYTYTAAVLKTLGIENWVTYREKQKPRKIQLSGGALDALMRLEPVCRALGICQRKT